MGDNSLRVRLLFEDDYILSKSQRWQGLKQSWLLLNRTQHPNISHLSDHLLHHFNLNRSCPHGLLLSMDDFVLPPFESTSILKDKEIISVKKKGSKLSNIVEVANNDGSAEELEIEENKTLPHGVQLLANEEFDKESGGYQSESEEDDDEIAIENTPGGIALSKKRKASERLPGSKKKKHKSAVPDGAKRNCLTNVIKSRNGDGVAVSKSHYRKEILSNAKTKDDSTNTSESTESSSCDESAKSVQSDQQKENDKVIEDTSCAPMKKLPSRSARRKKAKRQWLRAMAKIGKEEVCDSKRPKQQQRPAKAEKKEVICQSKGLLHWKQSREGYDQYKKEDIAPMTLRPGHIRFETLDEDEIVQKSQVTMETFQGNANKIEEQKWGTEKISSTQRKDDANINKNQSDTPNNGKDTAISAPTEFDKLPPLPGNLPQEGYLIAYRLLELSSSWTPEPSEFRVGRVLSYKPESRTIMLVPVPEYPINLEKLDGDESASQPDNSLYDEDGSLEIEFPSLLDVRIVKCSDANTGQDAMVNVNEVSIMNEDATPNLLNFSDKEKQTTNKENGEVNMRDHFTEVLDTKKAELSENNWSSWTEGASKKSCPSYRAWRGSAVGPTIARLRLKQNE